MENGTHRIRRGIGSDQIRSDTVCISSLVPLPVYAEAKKFTGTQFIVNLIPFMRHSLMRRSSAALTMRGSEGWNTAQFTPRSCPSSRCFTSASAVPNNSGCPVPRNELTSSSRPLMPPGPGETFFLRNPSCFVQLQYYKYIVLVVLGKS